MRGGQSNDPPTLRRFLAALSDESGSLIPASDVAVVVAHPDDETVGCGALLARLSGVKIVLVTDGAPKNPRYANACGFATPADYARARRREFLAALSVAGIGEDSVTELGIADQEAAEHLAEIARQLDRLYAQWETRLALTHAYEGGHFDHDAAAFAVHAAARRAGRRGQAVDIVEMPFYRAGDAGELKQSFSSSAGEVVIHLSPAETARKRDMLACHATQTPVLQGFAIDRERFRPSPGYDFSELPNEGRLLYEAHDWNMSGAKWRDLVAAARARLEE